MALSKPPRPSGGAAKEGHFRTRKDTMRIYVTLDDIVNGVPAEGNECAVARALNNAGFARVDVDDDYIRIFSDPPFFFNSRRIVTPEWLADWIKAFDRGDEIVDPFTFELDLAAKTITKCENEPMPLIDLIELGETRTADDLELVCV